MQARPYRHYILTRFNLGVYNPRPDTMFGKINLSPDEWMQHRMTLFTTYTLPSIQKQTCQNFTWMVLVDDATPVQWRQQLEQINYPNLKLIYMDINRDHMIYDTVAHFEKGDFAIITTRIDNDDAFHADAVAAIQNCYEQQTSSSPWAIIFEYGCVYDPNTKDFFMCRHPFNNCSTLIEHTSTPETIWATIHTEVPQKFPTVFIKEHPYWLMVCHDQNLANAIETGKHMQVFTDKHIPPKFFELFNVNQNRMFT